MEKYIELHEIMEGLYQYIYYYLPHIDDYIGIIDSLSKEVMKNIAEYYLKNDISPFQNDEFIEMNVSEKIELLDHFFKEYHINFDVYKIFNEGIVQLECRDFHEYNENGRFKEGYNRYLDDKKSIDIFDHGILLDSVTWLHEITHYRNQIDKDRSEEGKIFTEVVSFIYELFFLEYLEKNDYPIKDYYLDDLDGQAGMLKTMSPIISLLHVYMKSGEVSYQNFKLLYPDNSLEANEYIEYYSPRDFSYQVDYVLDTFHDCCCEEEFYRSTLVGLMYSFALPLQMYLYHQYQEDRNYFKKIENLNSIMNTSDFMECMNTIGINTIDKELISKVGNYTYEYINQVGEYAKIYQYKGE